MDSRLRTWIEQQIAEAVGGWGHRVGHAHVRLYGEVGGPTLCTCFVRVDLLPNRGVALGETAADPGIAVARTVARIGVAVGREMEERARALSALVEDGTIAQGGELDLKSRPPFIRRCALAAILPPAPSD